MSRRKKILAIAALAPALAALAFPVIYMVSSEARSWIKFRIQYRDYLAWKEVGGAFELRFSEPLNLDRDRDEMVAGLSYEQILTKFPWLTDGGQYPPTSYKGQHLKAVREASPETRLLWFRREDDFDWCVSINRARTEILLIKG